MRIVRDLESCPIDSQGAVVALGNFDGVHLGHQAILKRCIEIAKTNKTKAAVMTFEPHPREFFGRDKEKLRIYSFRQKATALEDLGVDILFAARFNARFAAQSAQDFVNILHANLKARHIVTGFNFAFGKGRGGNAEFLAKACAELGMGFTACPLVMDSEGEPISSSEIREALKAGDMANASKLLGRPYAIEGHVKRGEGRGAGLGFPTANLSLGKLFAPKLGIYAARARLDGAWRNAAVSVGVNPTFGAKNPLLEAHIFGVNRALYGERMRVELKEYMRGEKRFDDMESLKAQIASDCLQAKELLGKRA